MSYREVGQVTDNGLIKGHAYAITDTEQAGIKTTAKCKNLFFSFFFFNKKGAKSINQHFPLGSKFTEAS